MKKHPPCFQTVNALHAPRIGASAAHLWRFHRLQRGQVLYPSICGLIELCGEPYDMIGRHTTREVIRNGSCWLLRQGPRRAASRTFPFILTLSDTTYE